MMRRLSICLILYAVLSSISVYGQQESRLDAFYESLAEGCVTLRGEYQIAMPQTRITAVTDVMIQGESYVMKTDDFQVYCDGEAVWTVDFNSKEVYVEPLVSDPQTGNMNPILLFADLKDSFKVESADQNASQTKYVLNSADSDDVLSAEIVVGDAGQLRSMLLTLADGVTMSVYVSSMRVEEKKTVTAFRPQSDFGSEWIVTDLR